jgi:hypothetical protein
MHRLWQQLAAIQPAGMQIANCISLHDLETEVATVWMEENN